MAYNGYQPYPVYPVTGYQQYSAMQQPQYAQQPSAAYQPQQNSAGIVWVDGEVGAKAYQLPANWPANAPMPLWDTNDTIIYLKSTNPMGMPNPLQKIHYRMDETNRTPVMQSGQAALPTPEHTVSGDEYATKDDLERLKQEITAAITNAGNIRKGGKPNESAV